MLQQLMNMCMRPSCYVDWSKLPRQLTRNVSALKVLSVAVSCAVYGS
jgi:hypothetical protein